MRKEAGGDRRKPVKVQHVRITGYNIISFSRTYQVIIKGTICEHWMILKMVYTLYKLQCFPGSSNS